MARWYSMIKIAKDFFEFQSVKINQLEDFFKSDLCLYFEKLYKKKLVISDSGFIKIIRKEESIFLYENIFYDWGQEESKEFINFENVKINSSFIYNTGIGKELSQKGYCTIANDPKEIHELIKLVTTLNFNPDGCNRQTEPNGMFKFNPKVWGKVDLNNPKHVNGNAYKLYMGMQKKINEIFLFSGVLSSLDCYDMICLKWSDNRRILPHNDLDIRMFVNLISYWDETLEPRYLKVGEYDWYNYLFPILLTNQWEETNNITCEKKEYESIPSTRYMSPIVNVFNPRFYHETTPLRSGSMFSISAHKTFKNIVEGMELVR